MKAAENRERKGHTVAATVVSLGLVSLLATSGCSVVKATNQPDKKNLAVLSNGFPRSHVIAELGAPGWSEEKNGGRTDIFSFKQGYSKGAKVGRAFFYGAADLVTLGMWEVVGTPVETIASGTDVKVQVTYDHDDRVQGVEYLEGSKN